MVLIKKFSKDLESFFMEKLLIFQQFLTKNFYSENKSL
ncbi:hypothetical protein P344_04975 [Spiroplasma mirum ATCC 29335]|uniref:Uncharacterized protein n=1 Tax=Spiroplasma mirum ATCC 29335 TaxID=838561 RepID=W6AMC5_9MOLU|nr:hypothetical protein P344_04975 [Spiroplasma mirum ATCC 29335]